LLGNGGNQIQLCAPREKTSSSIRWKENSAKLKMMTCRETPEMKLMSGRAQLMFGVE
jgi:hypothetical protein